MTEIEIPLLSPTVVEREINDHTVAFYMCSLSTCARLSGLLSKMAGHLTVLLGTDGSKDQGRIEEDFIEDGTTMSKTAYSPINPDLARLRTSQKQNAVEGAINALLDDKNRAAVGRLIMDSMRDIFPRRKKRTDDECREFVDHMDLAVFMQFVSGMAAANAKLFGDLGKTLGRAVQDQAEKLLGKEKVGAGIDSDPKQ